MTAQLNQNRDAFLSALQRALSILIALVFSIHTHAAEHSEPATTKKTSSLDVYTGPKFKEGDMPDYQDPSDQGGREAWVQLSYMIDSTGKPYEISVTNSIGNEVFESLAVEAARNWLYEPATLNGVPVASSHSEKVRFILRGGGVARLKLRKTYRRALNAIAAKDRAAAEIGHPPLDVPGSRLALTVDSHQFPVDLPSQSPPQFV